ncbi:MAG: porin [Pirellulales bacterium]
MRISRLVAATAVLGTLVCGRVMAQSVSTAGLRQPASVQSASFNDTAYLAEGEGAGASPSDKSVPPPAPGPAVPVAPEVAPPAEVPPASASGEPCETCGECGGPCGACDCGGLGCGLLPCYEKGDPWRMFGDIEFLKERKLTVAGWVDQGYTWNPDNPADRFNTPVGFNDRANEYMMNQLYLYAERPTDTGGCGWDLGGRVDLLYGTDYRFVRTIGFDNEWNSNLYGLVMPQLYAEVAVNDLKVKVGHFYTLCGYEVTPAIGNFFYSHSYSFLYGEPITHTGFLATYALDKQWSIAGGLTRGWDTWAPVDSGQFGFHGGAAWKSEDENSTLAYYLHLGPEPGVPIGGTSIEGDRFAYSLVFTQKLTDRWTYVFQHDLGTQNDAARAPFTGEASDAQWYSICQYLFYSINDCWSAGTRLEWFRDNNGTRVAWFDNLSDNRGSFWELTWGVNYKPTANITARSELRYDWSNAHATIGANDRPFDDNSAGAQFLWGNDIVITF